MNLQNKWLVDGSSFYYHSLHSDCFNLVTKIYLYIFFKKAYSSKYCLYPVGLIHQVIIYFGNNSLGFPSTLVLSKFCNIITKKGVCIDLEHLEKRKKWTFQLVRTYSLKNQIKYVLTNFFLKRAFNLGWPKVFHFYCHSYFLAM